MNIATKAKAFSEREIAPRQNLSESHDFPHDLWSAMGREGLLGLYIPTTESGGGTNEQEVLQVGDHLVRHGGNLGIVLSWLVHNLVASQVIGRFGTAAQKERWLPALARGEVTASMAVSEPGMGGSPKRLSTRADLAEGGYQLNGRKMYLTNGPIANLFVVFAVTGEAEGRKRFGAFLVERDRPGLTITADGSVDFLLPSPHGGIELVDCLIPQENLLGKEGDAFSVISKPFRFIEDALGMGPLLGGMKQQLDWVASQLRTKDSETLNDATAALGRLWLSVESIEVLMGTVVEGFEAAVAIGTPPNALLSARLIAARFQNDFTEFLDEQGMKADSGVNLLTRDMRKLTGLGRGIAEVHHRRLGIKALQMDV